MNKKIVKVMVFYEDGTFSELAQQTVPSLTYPPGVRTPEPIIPRGPFTPGCPKCGAFTTGSCGKLDCPNGHINPWDNSPKVTD